MPLSRKLLLFSSLLLLFVTAPGALAQQVSLPLTVSDGMGNARTLAFGLDPSATSGIDPALGEEELPPFPPTGAFEARFAGDAIGIPELQLGSYRDFRSGDADFAGEVIHQVRFQPGDGTAITITWDLPESVAGRLQDFINGTLVDVTMSGQGSTTILNPAAIPTLKMTITYGVSTNQPPVANDVTASTPRTVPVLLDVLANDSDPDGDGLSLVAVTQPSNGTAQIEGAQVRYTPNQLFVGQDVFTYSITDGEAQASATVTITVTPANQVPVISSTPQTTVAAGQAYSYTVTAVDPDGDPLIFSAATLPEWLVFDGIGPTSATLSGSPLNTDTGEHAISLTVSDGFDTVEQAFTVVVIYTPPTAASILTPADGSALTLEGSGETVVEVTWTASTVPGPSLSYRWEAALSTDFAEPVLIAETGDTGFETTFAVLDDMLAEAGVEAGASASLFHRVIASDGVTETTGPGATVTLTRGMLSSGEEGAPLAFALHGAYPNPTTGSAVVALDLPSFAAVTVEVFDLLGRRVLALAEAHLEPGAHRMAVDLDRLGPGSYLYRLTASGDGLSERATGRLVVVR